MSFEIEGLKELENNLKKIGGMPKKFVAPAARAGAKIAHKTAKDKAGQLKERSGNLVNGIIMKGERKPAGMAKKVYDIKMDPKMTELFVRKTKSGMRGVNKNGARVYKEGDYYYPAALEFGWIKRNGEKHEGYHFLRDSLIEPRDAIEDAMLDKLSKEIDKELKKRG